LEEDFQRAGSLNLTLFGTPTLEVELNDHIETLSLLVDVMYDLLTHYFEEISLLITLTQASERRI
jgi:hypothetical protein